MAKLEVSGIDEIIVFVMIIASHDELLFNLVIEALHGHVMNYLRSK